MSIEYQVSETQLLQPGTYFSEIFWSPLLTPLGKLLIMPLELSSKARSSPHGHCVCYMDKQCPRIWCRWWCWCSVWDWPLRFVTFFRVSVEHNCAWCTHDSTTKCCHNEALDVKTSTLLAPIIVPRQSETSSHSVQEGSANVSLNMVAILFETWPCHENVMLCASVQ